MDDREHVDQQMVESAQNVRSYLLQMQSSVSVLKWIWTELMDEHGRFRLGRMFRWQILASAFSLLPMWLLGLIVDDLSTGRNGRMWWFVGGVGASLALAQLSNMVMSWHREWAIGHNMGTSDKRMSELFFAQSVGQHTSEGSRLSASNLEKARGRIMGLTDMLVFQGFASLLRLGISFVFLFVISPFAGLVMTALLLHYLAWMVYLNRKVMAVCTPLDREFRRHNRYRNDVWDLVTRVKHSAKEAVDVAFMDRWFGDIIKKDRAFWMWYITISNLRAIVRAVVVTGVLAYSVWQIEQSRVELAVLVPLFIWSHGIADNLWQIGQVERVVSWNMPSIRSMMEALTVPPSVVSLPDAPGLSGEGPISVEFKSVTHTYDGHERGARPVLKDVSLTVAPGERVALVGMTGSGKSTIARLLLRDFDPDEGEVRLNGDDLRTLDLSEVLTQIAHIPQKPPILDGTIRHNVLYALSEEEREAVTDEHIWAVLSRVQLALRERFRDGLDTRVGRTGVKLSGGEQQRLMIAAAIIQRVRFIIIDEATSSLDALTERRVQSGIEEILREGVTALIIAHRFSTIRFCDRVIVLRPATELDDDYPQIEAVGTFEELLVLSPTFRTLAELQEMVPARAS
ncbi:hypothetical protein A3B32_03255 [Candidatus Uhrbacteria bacterium RIFCSPLOWO2_01_FULL_53_9]|uniref:ABC transporter domain-containing protein n=2 Tax=Candidatus Uhriibacteriota TaxID=1752732 RepID=A0A1F7UYS9_9BACT|nr:MAG: hypothetical protein A3C17_03485 [Candidatus Uhrbacteria bacterium RIFCSPHIGHO2_02_FULL_53_13]OGL83422.1 MAG: hypothetical protein A3B32_03255 [Candidatus Uhrbacteria bacterium RIFCSPLOWO2_01_FULL_53_9]